MKQHLVSAIDRLRSREEQLFLILTVAVGVIAGLSAVLFSLTIAVVNRTLFGLSPSALRMVMVPIAGGLVSGLLLARVITGVVAAACRRPRPRFTSTAESFRRTCHLANS